MKEQLILTSGLIAHSESFSRQSKDSDSPEAKQLQQTLSQMLQLL